MKELIKKRWFVFLLGILIAVIAVMIVGLILYCNGYRIVYPEQFETSWDAVSGFAAWFGVVVSVVSAAASFFAIWFAVRVADKQNKIALFEKRCELYDIAISCRLFATMLEQKQDIEKAFLASFCKMSAGIKKADSSFVREQCSSIGLKVAQFSFLFENQNVFLSMEYVLYLMIAIVKNYENKKETFGDKTQTFIKVVRGKQFARILKMMEKELTLK